MSKRTKESGAELVTLKRLEKDIIYIDRQVVLCPFSVEIGGEWNVLVKITKEKTSDRVVARPLGGGISAGEGPSAALYREMIEEINEEIDLETVEPIKDHVEGFKWNGKEITEYYRIVDADFISNIPRKRGFVTGYTKKGKKVFAHYIPVSNLLNNCYHGYIDIVPEIFKGYLESMNQLITWATKG